MMNLSQNFKVSTMSSLESCKSYGGPSIYSKKRDQPRSSARCPRIHDKQIAVQERKHLGRRVLRACERCKVKKVKCDAGAPCRRCKDDGMVCGPSSKRRTEYTTVPHGYAEVLENTHLSLVATVEKLYFMLKNEESWELDDPEMNEDGRPVIHDIAKALGCVREPQHDVRDWPERPDELTCLKARIHLSEQNHDLTSCPGNWGASVCEPERSKVFNAELNTVTMDAPLQQEIETSYLEYEPFDHGSWCSRHQFDNQMHVSEALTTPPILTEIDICSTQSSRLQIEALDSPSEMDYFDSGSSMDLFLDANLWSDIIAWQMFTDPQEQFAALDSF
ncbi:hypothetical protein BDZ45DRAFT_727107 [Acephala macrosclerotiorum]|nr:hypothetical protein BDZ45DRAFT_727107 [Acephala macrosclerotiorum]